MYKYITEWHQIGDFISALQKVERLAFDTETTGLDPFTDKLLLIQIKAGEEIFLFDCRKLGEKLTTYIIQLLKDSGKQLVGFNLKFDVKMVKTNTGELLTNPLFDVMLAEILVTNGIAKGEDRFPSLADLTKKYLNIELAKETRNEFVGLTGDITENMLIYSALDVEHLFSLADCLDSVLEEQKQLKVAYEIEFPVVHVVACMELEGVLVDKESWFKLVDVATAKAEAFRKDIVSEIIDTVISVGNFNNALEACEALLIKEPLKTKRNKAILETISLLDSVKDYLVENFNLNSSDQLKNVLVKYYKIPVESTNEKIINKFADKYDIINKILSYREFAKKVSSFGEKFFSNVNKTTGRIHSDFNQLGAQSGRFASSDINLQNVPKEQEYRACFRARPGKKLICTDFSQEELRLIAVVAKVKKMIEAYNAGIDLHVASGAGLYGVPVEQVTKEQRSRGKSLNFAVGYGSTEWGLWKNFGIPMEEGKILLKKFYKELYPEIEQCKELVGTFVREKGYSTTLSGRKRYFDVSKTFFEGGQKERDRYFAAIEREAFNHIIQGTGSDIIKKSLYRIFTENPFGDGLKILIQVYDEIVCEADESIAREARDFVVHIMTEVEREYLKDVVPAEVESADEKTIADYWVH